MVGLLRVVGHEDCTLIWYLTRRSRKLLVMPCYHKNHSLCLWPLSVSRSVSLYPCIDLCLCSCLYPCPCLCSCLYLCMFLSLSTQSLLPTVLHRRWYSRKSLTRSQTLNLRLLILSNCKEGHWSVERSEHWVLVYQWIFTGTLEPCYGTLYWLSIACLRES